MSNKTIVLCHNVFKSKEKMKRTQQYTNKWIALIHAWEENKFFIKLR